MKNTRTLISSSLVSIIIVVLGLFMLCMSRAPQLTFDEPLVEGGGVESDTLAAGDEDFLSLLNDDSGTTSTDNNQQDSSNEDDFLSLLGGDDTNSNTSNSSSESSDEGMDEILRLLDLDEDTTSQDQTGADDNEFLSLLNEEQPGETTTQSTDLEEMLSDPSSNSPGVDEIDGLSQEVERLEGVLANKTTTVDSLQTEIDQYDQQLSATSNQNTSSGHKTTVQPVGYYESAASRKSGYNTATDYGEAYSGGDYEGSYNTALSLFQGHQYEPAVEAFFELLQQDSRHPLADNCQYWLGECRFAQGKYYQAVVEFNKVFAYDAPDKQDDAQLMLGLAYMKLGELTSARSEFDWLVDCYASSEYVNTANRYLTQL